MQTSDPDAKKRSQQLDLVLGVVLVLVLAAAAFQVFLRYTYVHTTGTTVVRVDRLSGDSCALPCNEGYGPVVEPYTAPPSPKPDKLCHGANVVRVAGVMRPPVTRTPTPYALGGYRTSVARRWRRSHRLNHAVELTDGHIYVFPAAAYAADVAGWSTGQDVDVCATWSRLEQRPYYSVGSGGDTYPATLAL